MAKLQELIDRRVTIINNARKTRDEIKNSGKDATADQEAAFDKAMDDADKLKDEIDAEEKAEKVRAERDARLVAHESDLRQLNRGDLRSLGVSGVGGAMPHGDGPSAVDFAAALQGWFINQTGEAEVEERHVNAAGRCGLNLNTKQLTFDLANDYKRLKVDIKNALSSNVPELGGVLRFGEILGPMEIAMYQHSPMMELADIIRTSHANPLPWPSVNDGTTSGRQIGENQPTTGATEMQFKQTIWGAYKFTTDEILVPYELLRDASGVNLPGLIGDLFGERLGRIINTRFTVGSGAGTAEGIVVGSTLGVTAAGSAAITADELIDLQESVPEPYTVGAGFMMRKETRKAIRKLKDGEGRYLFEASITKGVPDTLLGWDLTTNVDMATMASGAKSVLAGQFKRYKGRQVGKIRMYRLTERARANDQDVFLAFIEADGKLLNAGANPVVHLLHP